MDYKENEIEDLENIYKDVNAVPIQISYAVMKSITRNFAQVIGNGGFGIVYLGAIRNELVAVKKLLPSKDVSDTQFLEEVKCLKKVNHKNIVRFLGYCADAQGVVMEVGEKNAIAEVQQRLLCFEYVPNGSLHNYLQEKAHGYEWSTRYKIIKGICEGLHYLHERRISHLDLKPENVLLGSQMEPKITDFGLSRFIDRNKSKIFTMNVLGTLGYIPPELIHEGEISFKSDMYSLGIIMTRLLTGITDTIIPDNWHESLNVDCQQMKRCIEIAQICTDHDPSKRRTISEIIYQLNETETTIKKVPDLLVSEPRYDPDTPQYQVVKRFWTLPTQTSGEYHRWPGKLPVERPKWKLAFHSPPKLPILTNEEIKDANGNLLEVILLDADTGEPSAHPNVLHIELVPLLGNFPRDYWDADDFQMGIVEDPYGKGRLLLVGEYRFTMWDGRATVNKIMFTYDSLNCGCMFRIGVRVVPGSYHGARILEAMTEAFMVRERQGGILEDYKWKLVFHSQPRQPIYVGSKITDVFGNPLEVILVDTKTGSPVVSPKELNIQIVVLYELDDVLRQEDVVEPEEGKGPFLSGDVSLTMKYDGRVTVNELQFTDDPPKLQFTDDTEWATSKKYRFGVRVMPGSYHGHDDSILEGVTDAFYVLDPPGLGDNGKKKYPPGLGDEVWRLEEISWGGVFHKRLTQNNIRNVQDFLRMLAAKPDELREIMGDGMEDDSTWDKITRHARTCVSPDNKVYAYSTMHATIYVNSIFDLMKVTFRGVDGSLQQQDEAQKILLKQTIREAYEHRDNLQETWKLAFKRQPRLPIHTGSRIEDATGNPLEIILVDAITGSPAAFPRKVLYLELVPLLGDFPPYEDWSAEEFQMAIVKQRQDDVPLLKGYNYVCMRAGRATVTSTLQFTDDSSWVRSRKFRIGACVEADFDHNGARRIVEAITEAFVVEDLNRKHYPPVLSDPVWRLEMIDKDGAAHKKLTSINVHTVQQFRRMLKVKRNELYAILREAGFTEEMCNVALDHSCRLDGGDKVYAYSGANGTIFVDSVFDRLFKIEMDGVEYHSLGQLDMARSMLVYQLLEEACEHPHNLQEVGTATELYGNNSMDTNRLLSYTYVERVRKPSSRIPVKDTLPFENLPYFKIEDFKQQPVQRGCRYLDTLPFENLQYLKIEDFKQQPVQREDEKELEYFKFF